MAVEPEVFSDGVWIGIEAAAPKAITDEDGSRAVQSFFFGAEFTAQHGRDGPDLKETGRHPGTGNFLRKRARGFRDVLRVVAGKGLKGGIQAIPVL